MFKILKFWLSVFPAQMNWQTGTIRFIQKVKERKFIMETRLKLEGFHLVHFSELAQVAFSCCDRCHTSGLKICVGWLKLALVRNCQVNFLSAERVQFPQIGQSESWQEKHSPRETENQYQFYLAKIPSHPRSFPSRIQMLMKNVWHINISIKVL